VDDETKFRFDDVDRKMGTLDKKIDDQGKRFDDVKWFVGGTSIIFSALVLIAGWNYNSEREGLRDFQKEVREQVSKTDDSKLDLYGVNGVELAGQEVAATVVVAPPNDKSSDQPNPYIDFSFVIRNTGDNTSGPMYIKMYTREDLQLTEKSSDETAYKYEAYLTPQDQTPGSIPARMSIIRGIQFLLASNYRISPGRHSALLKVYYGKGKLASASFYIVTQ